MWIVRPADQVQAFACGLARFVINNAAGRENLRRPFWDGGDGRERPLTACIRIGALTNC